VNYGDLSGKLQLDYFGAKGVKWVTTALSVRPKPRSVDTSEIPSDKETAIFIGHPLLSNATSLCLKLIGSLSRYDETTFFAKLPTAGMRPEKLEFSSIETGDEHSLGIVSKIQQELNLHSLYLSCNRI